MVYPFPLPCAVFEMPECRTDQNPVSLVPEMKKNADAEASPIPEKGNPVRYRNALEPD